MSSVEKIRQLKKIVKEADNIVEWQGRIYDELRALRKRLYDDFIAGAAITVGQVVYVSGDNQVSPADNTTRSQTIGVALDTVGIGFGVRVCIYGKVEGVVADGAIAAGDPVTAAATAGRVVSLTTHSHTIAAPTTAGFVNSIPGATGVEPDHRHDCPSTGYKTAGTPSGSIGNHDSSKEAGFIAQTAYGGKYAAPASGGSPTFEFIAVTAFRLTHYYLYGDHAHVFTGSEMATHRHSVGNTAYEGAHSHTIAAPGTASAVTAIPGNTGTVGTAQIVGKALTAAVGAGSTLDLLVCLAG